MSAAYYPKRHGTDRKPRYFVPPLRDVSTDFPIHESQLNRIPSRVTLPPPGRTNNAFNPSRANESRQEWRDRLK